MMTHTAPSGTCYRAGGPKQACSPAKVHTGSSVHKQRCRCAASARPDAQLDLSRRAALTTVVLTPFLVRGARADEDIKSKSRPTVELTDSASAQDPKSIDWGALKQDILDLIKDEKSPGGIGDKGPTLVRLAWHSSGTYDRMTRTGGSGAGSIRFKTELDHGANAGLNKPVEWLEDIHQKHPEVSYADLFTFAGAVAIEAMGGPNIKWRAGRVDTLDESQVTPDGRLPDADKGSPPKTAQGLRDTFYRMGFNDREIVALSGAHALGRCHADASGYVGPWTGTPTIFSNLYFKLLLKAKWTPDERQKKFQYKDASGTLMMLPSDIVLTQDPEFKQYVELYAKDKKQFYADFSKAFTQLEELGCKNLVEVAV